MRLPPLLRSVIALFAFSTSVLATIDPTLQMQLGNPTNATSDSTNHAHYLIQRAQYALDFNDSNGEPNWVSWDLTTADLGSSGRGTFQADTTLPADFTVVQPTDYSGSGYDRGHMCPSADRTVTVADNEVLFYMSNMIPQAPDNNQGVWANFEEYCRDEAGLGNELLITCGPSSFSGSRIPSGAAAIPGYTWKIVVIVPAGSGSALSRITSSTRVIAVKIPNIAGVRDDPWQNYITTVNQIESDTGFSFFSALPASVATALKAEVDGQSSVGAPSLTTQPVAQTSPLGGNATFTVAASGNDPLTYQWVKDDDDIDGATSPTLALTNIQATDAGDYYCVVTNGVGSVTSNAAALVVTGVAPSITTSPASVIVNAGAKTEFVVEASGSPTLTYQWRFNGAPIPGATLSTYTLSDPQAASQGNYDVVVSNSTGSVTTAAASLTVNAVAPTLTLQPSASTVSVGASTTVSVTAQGSEPLTYQWRQNGTPISDGGDFSGTATSTLTISPAALADTASYDCVVANSINAVTSSPAAVTVSTAPTQSTLYWDFTQVTPTSGMPANLSDGTVTQVNNNGTTTILSVTSASSGYTGASGGNNAGAACLTGTLSTATSTYFQVNLAPSIAGQAVTVTSLTFGSRSTSTGPQAYTIYSSVDNYANPVASGALSNTSTWALISPALASPVKGAVGAPVTLRIYGSAGTGSAAKSTANWRIDDLKILASASAPPPVTPAVVSTSPLASAANIDPSAPIVITFNEPVTVGGNWFTITSALNGPIAATVSGGPTTFTLTPPGPFAIGDTVTVTINASEITDQATGSLKLASNLSFSFTTAQPVAPAITSDPQSVTVTAGGSATFSVGATGTNPLAYQWRKNGTAITGNGTATTASLVLSSVAPSDGANYDCVVSNSAGSATSAAAALTVSAVAPTIVNSPLAQTGQIGGTLTLSVTASGTAPLTYQWRKGGTDLADGGEYSGTQTATLTLTGLTLGDNTTFDVVVSNAAGSATSTAATLTVTNPVVVGGIYWDFTTASPTSGLPSDVTGGTLSSVNNYGTTTLVTSVSVSSGYTGASGAGNAGLACKIGALNLSSSPYFTFTLTPNAGESLVTGSISFGARSTSTGPQGYAIYTSADNYSAPIATGTMLANSAWVLFSPQLTGVLTGPSGAPVTYRIYGYGGAGSPGSGTANWRIDDLRVGVTTSVTATAPTVASTNPAQGATAISQTSAIQIAFSEPVNVSGSWYSISGAASGPITATVSGGPTAFTLTPVGGLPNGDTVTVTLNPALITDQATGTMTMTGTNSFSFATQLTIVQTPPSVTTDPTSQSVVAGSPASFTVAATATGPAALSYQWRFNGAPITTNPSALTATLTLPSASVADAGSYDCLVSNSAGSATSAAATLTVTPQPATVTLSGLSGTYSGAAQPATATTNPSGVAVTITYNASSDAPVNAGSYAVTATITDPNYSGSASGTLVISPAPATVTLGSLNASYDGSAKTAVATTAPAGLSVTLTYAGGSAAPVNAGSYPVSAVITDPNYVGSTSGTLVISPALAVVGLGNLSQTYTGSAEAATVSTSPSGLNVITTYDGSSTPPTNVGTYAVAVSVSDPNYSGSAGGSLVISPATAGVILGNLAQTYDGTAKMASVTTAPAGLATQVTYNGGSAAPSAVGTYAVVAKVTNPNYAGTASGTLKIAQASATLSLGALLQAYDGTAKSVTVSSTPASLATTVTYNGSATPPTLPGTYAVTATSIDPSYSGSISDTLTISVTALVNHAPTLNGIVAGSVQVLSAESFALNSSASISGDILVPGTPSVTINGHPTYGGTVDSTGTAAPTSYAVTLNSGAVLRHLVRKVNAIAMPSVSAPPKPTGTRSVSINASGQSAGDFTTLNNLTLNGNAGSMAVPPGTYGTLTANGSSSFVLGVAGSTAPTVYNLQGLTLNGTSTLTVVGPVILTVNNGVTLNGSMGVSAHPSWVTLRVSNGGLTLNGSVSFSGFVTAPTGTVTINGSTALTGEVEADRLTINGNGLLSDPLLP